MLAYFMEMSGLAIVFIMGMIYLDYKSKNQKQLITIYKADQLI